MNEKERKESGELKRNATVSYLETAQQKGSRQIKREVEFFNSDAISKHSSAQSIYLKTDTRNTTSFRTGCLNSNQIN
ncbi:hypothetical protein EGM51_16320 [Verrucomicrobia bacterium S94]|nr:hypothetical protein EGM51_16320 [Verrucomicrobia bacterium S94]